MSTQLTRQTSQSSNSHALLSTRTTSFSRHSPSRHHHVIQQSRNLSWWGSSASTPQNTPTPEAPASSNINISEPSDLRDIISPDRSFKASADTSSSELLSETSSTHNALEPQIIEDVQRAIAEPHLSDAPSLPPNLEDIPERIGYLKQVCGLDFGWGPTSTVQFMLEHLHITAGLSWTASIVVLGLVMRAMVFPFMVESAKEAQKMRDMKGVQEPIKEEYLAAKAAQDKMKMALAAQRMMALRKEFGSNPFKALLPPLVQIPFGFGCWRLLRNAAELPVPGFVTESWLWTSDLTFSDPYFIAPVVSATLTYLTISTNSRVNANSDTQQLQVWLKRILPVLTCGFVSFQPGAVQLYFVASSAMGLLTAYALQQVGIRRYLDMPPLQPAAPRPVPRPSPKKGAAAAPAATPNPEINTTPGGMQTLSMTQRHTMAEAERLAARKAEANEAQRTRDISKIDEYVNAAKGAGSRATTGLKDGWSSAFGMKDKITQEAGSKAERMREQRAADYEARVRATLDEKRRLRNEKIGAGKV